MIEPIVLLKIVFFGFFGAMALYLLLLWKMGR
jgi:hypothetical protein